MSSPRLVGLWQPWTRSYRCRNKCASITIILILAISLHIVELFMSLCSYSKINTKTLTLFWRFKILITKALIRLRDRRSARASSKARHRLGCIYRREAGDGVIGLGFGFAV